MATIIIVFRKDKINAKGEAPINIRIINNRKCTYVNTGIKIHQDFWDFKLNKVKPKFENSTRLNSLLTFKLAEIQNRINELNDKEILVSNSSIKKQTIIKENVLFVSFAEESIKQFWTENKIGTYDNNNSSLNKLRNFIKNKPITFENIDYGFLLKYENYLKIELKNSINTIHKDLKFIRKIFNEAYRQGIIEHEKIPFLKYKLKTEKTERFYLTEKELEQIELLQIPFGTRLDLHRDMFVFASYVGGLRISDLLQMQYKNFDNTHLNFTIKKTNGQLSLKLPNKAIEILLKYKIDRPKPNDFLFPMFNSNIDLNNAVQLDSSISSCTAYINKNLKLIAEKAGIEKKLSFHISRHTWATRALRKGISIDKVSKLMGHANIKETQIYAKIVNIELDKAMDIFNE